MMMGGYWLLSAGMIALLIYGMSTFRQSKQESTLAMYVMGAFFVIFIPKITIAAFHLLDDAFNLFGLGYSKIWSGVDWSRRNFITKAGFGIGSVSAAGDRLIILSEKGELIIAKATPEKFELIHRAQVSRGRHWNVPVLANGFLYVRNAAGNLQAIDVRTSPPAK